MSEESTKMEPKFRSIQVLKQEAEDIGLTGKEVADYVGEQQTLDRKDRVAWRDTQKRKVEIQTAELQAENLYKTGPCTTNPSLQSLAYK